MAGSVQVQQRDNVMVATIDNPPHALLTRSIQRQLADLARRADTDPSVGGVVLTGSHPTRFLAHFDVELIRRNAQRAPTMSPQQALTALKAVAGALRVPGADRVLPRSPAAALAAMEQANEVNLAIESCSAIWIAALNGDTGGGGCELALACDFRFMADGESRISQPEIFLGFPPGGGGTQRLARLLGRRAALRMCLDGGPLTPGEARDLGLVDRVLPPDELVEAAVAEAARLGRRPKRAIGAVKRAVNVGGSLPLVDGLRLETAEFLSAVTTEESLTAQDAYIRRMEELGDLPAGVPEEIDRVLQEGRFT